MLLGRELIVAGVRWFGCTSAPSQSRQIAGDSPHASSCIDTSVTSRSPGSLCPHRPIRPPSILSSTLGIATLSFVCRCCCLSLDVCVWITIPTAEHAVGAVQVGGRRSVGGAGGCAYLDT